MCIHIIRINSTSEKTKEPSLRENDAAIYKEEHQRLENIICDSENIWEDRTFQISAGGLTLTFTIFSFLSTRGVILDWNVFAIWMIYVLCIVLNYISHRISISKARKLQDFLCGQRKEGKPYDEKSINEEYKKQDKGLNFINCLVQTLLIIDIIYSLIYTCLHIL